MFSLEETFRAACRDREIPGAVLVATDKTGTSAIHLLNYSIQHSIFLGKFRYSKSFGVRSLEDGHQEPLEQDAIMGLASCTKLLTSIAALQCVERGLLQLDEDVVRVLPEFKDIEIISEADEPPGELKFKKATKAITLR